MRLVFVAGIQPLVVPADHGNADAFRWGFLPVRTLAGKGCFVAPKNVELIREQTLKEIESHLRESIRLAALCGLSYVQLQEMLSLLHEEDTP